MENRRQSKSIIVILMLFIIGFWNTVPVCAQTDTLENKGISKQVWIDVNPKYFINPKLEIYGDAGMRWEVENDGWMRIVLRPTLRGLVWDRFYFIAGIGNFYTLNKFIEDRWELRPFQGISFNWPRWRTPIHHYMRIEERFEFNTKTWDSRNSVRGRYKLGISHRWAAKQVDRYWQVSVMGEAFYTFAGQQGQFQEQARVTLGLDRSLRYELHFRFEITWQQEQLFYNTKESFSDIYFRFRYTYTWGNRL